MVFSIHVERIVNRDNTVKFRNLNLQIDRQDWRRSMEGCRVVVYQHFDGTISITFGPRKIGRYQADGLPLVAAKVKTPAGKGTSPLLPSKSQRGHLMC